MRGSRVTQALPSTSSDVGKGESEIPEEDHSPSYQVSHGQRGRIWPFFSLGCKSIMPQVSGRFCWAIGGKPRPQPASRVTYDNSEKKVKIMATSWHSTWPLLMPDESYFLNLEHEIEDLNWDILDTQEMEAVKKNSGEMASTSSKKVWPQMAHNRQRWRRLGKANVQQRSSRGSRKRFIYTIRNLCILLVNIHRWTIPFTGVHGKKRRNFKMVFVSCVLLIIKSKTLQILVIFSERLSCVF